MRWNAVTPRFGVQPVDDQGLGGVQVEGIDAQGVEVVGQLLGVGLVRLNGGHPFLVPQSLAWQGADGHAVRVYFFYCAVNGRVQVSVARSVAAGDVLACHDCFVQSGIKPLSTQGEHDFFRERNVCDGTGKFMAQVEDVHLGIQSFRRPVLRGHPQLFCCAAHRLWPGR